MLRLFWCGKHITDCFHYIFIHFWLISSHFCFNSAVHLIYTTFSAINRYFFLCKEKGD